MEYAIIAIVILGLFAAIAWRKTTAARVWVIRVQAGVPFLKKGTVSANVIHDLTDVLQRFGVRHGAIYGVRRGSTVRLQFSRTVPPKARQALRNVWGLHA